MMNRPEFIIFWLGMAKVGVVTSFLNHNLRGGCLGYPVRAPLGWHPVPALSPSCLLPARVTHVHLLGDDCPGQVHP